MNSNSSSASKRLRTENSFEDEKTSSADDGIVSLAAAESNKVETTENTSNSNAVVNVFTDDILPVIFGNREILSVVDLFNFRLVNRCWRDSATSVLLKGSFGKIALSFGEIEVSFNEDHNAATQIFGRTSHNHTHFEDISPNYRYFNSCQPTSFLSDLSALISTSPKFPCNSIHFYPQCTLGFENLCLLPDLNHQDPNDQDLRHFLSLYGKKIKKLSLSGKISKEAFQNLLHVQMPHLNCLDLQDFEGFQDQPQESGQMQVCPPQPSTLEIKDIFLGKSSVVTENQMDFVNDLINVSPNLSSIRNADVNSLLLLIEMGKCHLIKDLEFAPAFCDIQQISKLTDSIVEPRYSSLKLSKLTVKFEGTNVSSYFFAIKFLKTVLCSSMDSLKCLELVFKPSCLCVGNFILPLPNLECLKLVDLESSARPNTLSLGDMLGRSLQNSENSIISAIYFPRLREVKLEIGEQRNRTDKLMGFFSLEHLGSDGVTTIPGDTLPTVTNLEVTRFISFYRNISKLFPNLSTLKIKILSWCSLPNWIWTAFPKLERFEVSLQYLGMETNSVDSFFTGISPELCATIESDGASTEMKSEFKRSQPYIGDCKNLKEFKLNFEHGLYYKCASKVTAAHGFQDVIHRTKIIFSFESIQMSVREMEKTRQLLEPVAAFVEIRMKK